MSLKAARVRHDGPRVQLEVDGRLIFDAPWQDALAISDAIRTHAKKAEEEAGALRIIADQALIIRKGLPFGLTRRPDMLREALKEAKGSRLLRRALPGGIRSTSIVGTPALIKHGRIA